MKRLPWWKKLLFALVAIIFFFGSLELALRLVGFSFRADEIAFYVRGKRQDDMFEIIRPGMWEPEPNTARFNSEGFIGPLIPIPRTPGILRIAALGDSCTQWGERPYPTVLRERLEQELGEPVEVLNAGVILYSTEQGIRRFLERVQAYKPDIVIIYFGWNDHWMAPVQTDAVKLADAIPAATRCLIPYQASRVVQSVNFVVDIAREKVHDYAEMNRGWVIRVPPERYTENLHTLVRLIRENGAMPIIVTAPTDAEGNVSNWNGTLPAFRDLPYRDHMDLHDTYVELTRAASMEDQVPLVDARADFLGKSNLMLEDKIHPNPAGQQRIAELLVPTILEILDTGPAGKKLETKSSP